METDLSHIQCVIFDYAFTLSSDLYFKVSPTGVPEWRAVVQRVVFDREEIVNSWMCGKIGLNDIADILARETGMKGEEVFGYLRWGCMNLEFNEAVFRFARWVRSSSLRSALVTGNMDVFTDIVVPSHGLDGLFEVIVNSADFGTCDKTILWPLAFESLGADISYHNSLLIEDSEANIAEFRNRGGMAYRYVGDREFNEWLSKVSFGSENINI